MRRVRAETTTHPEQPNLAPRIRRPSAADLLDAKVCARPTISDRYLADRADRRSPVRVSRCGFGARMAGTLLPGNGSNACRMDDHAHRRIQSNEASQKANGVDFGLQYVKETSFGTFTSITQVTYLNSFEVHASPADQSNTSRRNDRSWALLPRRLIQLWTPQDRSLRRLVVRFGPRRRVAPRKN